MNKMFFAACVVMLLFLNGCNESSFENSGEVHQATESSVDKPNTQVNIIRDAVIEDSKASVRNPAQAADSQIFSFIGSQELEATYDITLDDKTVAIDFDLKNIYSDKADPHTQVDRTQLSEATNQGNPGLATRDTFDQEEKKGLLDILIVVDDSGSMTEEQKNLSTKLNALLSSISKTDWRIGVVTTTPKDACEISLINAGDADAISRFKTAVEAGINGSTQEKGIKEAVNGLKCTGNPWVRDNSSIAVLFISDEDNCSYNGKDCVGEPWVTPMYLIDYVETDMGRTVGVDAGFYGIFSDPAAPCATAFNQGVQYKQLVEYKANGNKNYGDICDASYATTLSLISKNISGLLRNQWELSAFPDSGTLQISIELNGVIEVVDSDSYTLVGKTLTFEEGMEPPANSKIIADYLVGKTPMFQQYTLQEKPAEATLVVKINGSLVDTFTLDGDTVIFDEEPPANAAVAFDYRRDEPLETKFQVEGSPRNDTINVFVDDQATDEFSYDPLTKLMTLDTAPPDLAKILIKYENLDGPQLDYKLPLGGQNPRDFKLFFNEAEITIAGRVADVFTIKNEDHAENRTLTLKYDVDDTEEKVFTLPYSPIEGSLKVSSTNEDCKLGAGFELKDLDQFTSTCIVQDATEFKLTFSYIGFRREFDAKVTEPELGRWIVKINGIETTEYEREGSVFTISADFPLGAAISIIYQYNI